MTPNEQKQRRQGFCRSWTMFGYWMRFYFPYLLAINIKGIKEQFASL